MRVHRKNWLVVGSISLLLLVMGCASDPSAHTSEDQPAGTNNAQEATPAEGPDSESDAGAAEITIPAGAYAANAEFPFPIPEGWMVLDEFTAGKLGKDITMDGRGLMSVLLTRVSSRRECDAAYINNFKLDRGKSAQPALATLPVILPLNPGNNRQAQLFSGCPHLPIKNTLLQKREEALHRRVIPGSTDPPHRPLQPVPA